MKIGFVVNDVKTEHPRYTTTRIARSAREAGHEAWEIGVGDFAVNTDDRVLAHAYMSKAKKHKDGESYLKDMLGDKGHHELIDVGELDVLMLRNDPADDAETPWAQTAGINFGELALRHGVIVLNDPGTLSNALNKMYFQHFSPEIRPRTVISRDVKEIQKFIKDEGGRAILKPLQGSGGAGVFLVQPEEKANINQMIEAISRDGYVIAQEYLAAAKDGDTRLFVVNGEPLVVDGHYAAFRRINAKGDARSNLTSGGNIAKAKIDDKMMALAESVRPKLVADGMFMVGLDIVGDKLMEINVLSPGGLGSAQELEDGTDFAGAIIEKLERKVRYRDHSQNDNFLRGMIDNKTIATL
ncbi:MAG: glutathione synthase [Blastocatellia bacterium]|nr:glutathione synthase [Blastocatellia bacterium]